MTIFYASYFAKECSPTGDSMEGSFYRARITHGDINDGTYNSIKLREKV